MFPPSVQEWPPKDHLARFVVDVVEQLDLSGLEESYPGRGGDAHHPAMLVALLLYGYATGTFSSRATAVEDRVKFQWLDGYRTAIDPKSAQGGLDLLRRS